MILRERLLWMAPYFLLR